MLSLFPRDVLDEMWDLIGSVSNGFSCLFFSVAPDLQCCYFCESSCLFYLIFKFNFCVSQIMHL